MAGADAIGEVRQLRLVVTAHYYDEAVAFYRDTLGFQQEAAYGIRGRAGHDPGGRAGDRRLNRGMAINQKSPASGGNDHDVDHAAANMGTFWSEAVTSWRFEAGSGRSATIVVDIATG